MQQRVLTSWLLGSLLPHLPQTQCYRHYATDTVLQTHTGMLDDYKAVGLHKGGQQRGAILMPLRFLQSAASPSSDRKAMATRHDCKCMLQKCPHSTLASGYLELQTQDT